MKRKAGNQSSNAGIEALTKQELPVVVLAGRVNAGKSTLFNRIARGGRAITSAIPGTTRDLNIAPASFDDHRFLLVDSGGLELDGRERLAARVTEVAANAIASADVVVYVVDGKAGLSAADNEALELIREVGRPFVVAVNKIDRSGTEEQASEFYALGCERLFCISAAHGNGVEQLLEAVVSMLRAPEATASEAPDLRLALIGRPNVGKSSLLNRLVGFERSIVDETPGTTRDAVDVRLQVDGRSVLLIDTAGIRRRTRVEGELERHSVGRAIETIRRAEVVALVIDATEGITDQDARLARLAVSEDRALILICNKWDLVAKQGGKTAAFSRDAHVRYPFLEFAPMIYTSALKGFGVNEILATAARVGSRFRQTFQTSRLNRILAEASAAMDPPLIAGRRLNLLYVSQTGSSPPRLKFYCNLERDIPAHYIRFLEARFRAALDLTGTPLRLEFQKRSPSKGGSSSDKRRSTSAA
ncbi:MAG TPA: ribosome biogenesis GTPase Der [Candidatus Binataceae bacterium]|nr:ribosome biogenesis GTPase Der [Candidatus Binataceae bacterium]